MDVARGIDAFPTVREKVKNENEVFCLRKSTLLLFCRHLALVYLLSSTISRLICMLAWNEKGCPLVLNLRKSVVVCRLHMNDEEWSDSG